MVYQYNINGVGLQPVKISGSEMAETVTGFGFQQIRRTGMVAGYIESTYVQNPLTH